MGENQKAIYVAATMEDLLDKSLILTNNCDDSLDLIKFDPQDVLFMRNGELKSIAAMLYVCVNSLQYRMMKVKFKEGYFNVEITI
jgi:sugar diacid utilization regulator